APANQDVVVIDWDAKRKQWDEEERAVFEGLPPVKKMFYKEDPRVAQLSEEDVAKIRLENRKISVSYQNKEVCEDAPNPVSTFHEAWQHFPDLLQLLLLRYEKPSPIQMQLWPVLLTGRDAIGIAQTGTGKTLAFLLPGLVNIQNQDPEPCQFKGPRMVVLAPTRELAIQIHDEVNKLNYHKNTSVCIYGKADRQKQLDGLNSGASVVVATPGRLDDLLRTKQVDLRRVSYVVFDEADRMLDMGFLHNLTFIISGIRRDRQFIMTSATWNNDIHYIAKNYLHDEILVRVGERELEATYTVSQEVVVCEEHEKFDKLMLFLKGCTGQDKGLVFVNRRVLCDPLCSQILEYYDYKFDDNTLVPETLYGSMEQEAREEALNAFRRGDCKLLICTDVAARGLDVIDVTFVINYDLPRNLEEYVHRSGRTGRAGREGNVLTFVSWKDRHLVRPFIEILARSNVAVSAELNNLAVRSDRANARGKREGGFSERGRYSWSGGRDKNKSFLERNASSYDASRNSSSGSS
ncbi:Helicase C-terminal, partial [Trinorchestia longiramus]